MKKLTLTLIILLISIASFGQNWKAYNIDDSLQVALPEGFSRKDSAGQTIISTKSTFGDILITKIPDSKISKKDKKERHLNRFYKNFIKQIKESKSASISNEKDTIIGKLRAKDVTLSVSNGNGLTINSIRILHENNATYVFRFNCKASDKTYAAPEAGTFFNSIDLLSISGLDSQFIKPDSYPGQKSLLSGRNILFLSLAIALIVIIFIIIRKKKSVNKPL